MTSHRTRGVEPILDQCSATVCDAGPTLNQHRVNPSCLRGMSRGRQTVMNKKVAFSEYSLTEVAQYTQTPRIVSPLGVFILRSSIPGYDQQAHSLVWLLTNSFTAVIVFCLFYQVKSQLFWMFKRPIYRNAWSQMKQIRGISTHFKWAKISKRHSGLRDVMGSFFACKYTRRIYLTIYIR